MNVVFLFDFSFEIMLVFFPKIFNFEESLKLIVVDSFILGFRRLLLATFLENLDLESSFVLLIVIVDSHA